jgi:glucose 1-dehydrogenase/3-oxoacyl-[acyl-carrier protein] reductase
MPDYTTEKGQSWVPWGRVGLPEDIGAVAVFLSSDGADFITGQVIYVDGGQTAKMSIPRD